MKPSITIKIKPQANAASYCSIRFFSAVFWGCPALQAGRAVSQLAIRSALRGLRPLGLACGHCCPSLSRGAARLGGGSAAAYWT
ncbi:hypothetical protein SGRA_2763 [Saprospira grandis str. Lewin]|uniref:Uncharacterized protein n=1 Tax=Saprospira grandis (strain Lewin) TaxID=984262 RepID=H6LA23_SAPGL|nr:hypothetical protein SGRA_2763 [Saprospira grandis str. Lewin]